MKTHTAYLTFHTKKRKEIVPITSDVGSSQRALLESTFLVLGLSKTWGTHIGEHLRALFSAVNISASNGTNALIEERRKMPLVAFLQLFQLPIIASNHSSTDR